MERIVFEIGEELKREFKLQCAKNEISQKEIIINLISKWVKNEKRTSNN